MHTSSPISLQHDALRVPSSGHTATKLTNGLSSYDDIQLIHMIPLSDDVNLHGTHGTQCSVAFGNEE